MEDLLTTTYHYVYDNYENIIKDEKIYEFLNNKQNKLYHYLKKCDNDITEREIQCKKYAITLLMLIDMA